MFISDSALPEDTPRENGPNIKLIIKRRTPGKDTHKCQEWAVKEWNVVEHHQEHRSIRLHQYSPAPGPSYERAGIYFYLANSQIYNFDRAI